MYICRECKAEYKQKVDYCDCGNNTFDFVEDAPVQAFKNTEKYTANIKAPKDIISSAFFVICLILSIIVWLIPVKSTPHKTTDTQKHEQQVQKANIPANIDKIWDDTPLYTPKKEQQPAVINEERQVPIPLTSTPVDYARRITEPAPKIIKQPLPIQQKPKTIVETPNIVQQSKPAPPVTVEQPKPVYNPNSPVMQKYKGSLRSALFSKFAAGSVQGAGTCEIQFSVDETGKLTNRKFLKESGNKSLDDAVYYMLMSVPKFTPPPDEYNGEPIRMKFIMNYGNYEISIN